jgi:hypothetical protein
MDDSTVTDKNPTDILKKIAPPRTHPPPLFYLPKVLLPEQEKFLKKRKDEVRMFLASLVF